MYHDLIPIPSICKLKPDIWKFTIEKAHTKSAILQIEADMCGHAVLSG